MLPIDIIFVPQGPEYRAVCRGLCYSRNDKPLIVPISIGGNSLKDALTKSEEAPSSHAEVSLATWQQAGSKVLLTGLCGGLWPRYRVGDLVLYRDCIKAGGETKPLQRQCDRTLTALLQQQLPTAVSLVTGYTSDRPICTSTEKRYLGQTYSADVVDMEGFTLLEILGRVSMTAATLRVISDDCHHDLPNLSSAISSNGSLQPLPLFKAMVGHPFAAARLIRGSLQGLKILEQTMATLFSEGKIND